MYAYAYISATPVQVEESNASCNTCEQDLYQEKYKKTVRN